MLAMVFSAPKPIRLQLLGGVKILMEKFIKKILIITEIDKKSYLLNQLWCIFCLIMYTVSSIIFPNFFSKIVDIGIVGNNIQAIIQYSLQMFLCGFIMVTFYYCQRVSFFKFGNKITLNTRKKVFKKLCNVNISFWNHHKIGDILTILNSDIDKLQELLTSNVSELIVNSVLAVGIALYVLMLNVKIGVAVIFLAVLFALTQIITSKLSKEKMKSLRHAVGNFNSYITETINNMPSLQMTGKINYVIKICADHCNILASRGLDFTRIISMVSVIGTSFNILAVITVLLIGAIDVTNGLLSVGMLFSMTIYVQRLYSPIVTLGSLLVKIRNFAPILDKIYNLFSTEDTISQGIYTPQDPLTGKVEFKNVSFAYNDRDYVIRDFSEVFEPGDVIGIIGENGSGKTTLCRLLTKLCRASQGVIEIDGIDIDDIDTSYLQTQIGVMTQDSFILTEEFNELICNEENIVSLQQYLESLNFRNTGYSISDVGFEMKENKVNISGGEAQKLALFKIYLENKPICILDEPTASLDPVSEEKMIEFISKKFRGKTVFIITHKPEIIRLCTKTVKLISKN